MRKNTAQTRGNEQVPHLDVGITGKIRQCQPIQMPGTQCDGSKAVTIDLHGYGMAGISNQHDFRTQGVGSQNLSDHAIGIKNRLTCINAETGSLVDFNHMLVGNQFDGKQFGNQNLLPHLEGGIQQPAQADIFLFEGCKFELPGFEYQHIVLKLVVFFKQCQTGL